MSSLGQPAPVQGVCIFRGELQRHIVVSDCRIEFPHHQVVKSAVTKGAGRVRIQANGVIEILDRAFMFTLEVVRVAAVFEGQLELRIKQGLSLIA